MSTPAVQGLSGYGLEVPDLEEATAFYSAFGLKSERSGNAVALTCPGRDQADIVLLKGPAKRLHHVSFFIRPGAAEAFADKLRNDGMEVREDAPDGSPRQGLWFQDPWGTWIHLNPSEAHTADAPTGPPSNLYDRAERVDMHLWRELQKDRPPRRIGHMLLFTPDWEKAEEFFQNSLGLRISDRVTGKVTFMAAGEGIIDHHCFGLIPSTHRGFQHASFQVSGWDDIGFGAWRMREAGYKEGFGPGRHAIASNLFYYARDPWGSWVEYYADMDKISPDWTSNDFDTLPYIWGPEWSPEFWGGEMNANLEPAS